LAKGKISKNKILIKSLSDYLKNPEDMPLDVEDNPINIDLVQKEKQSYLSIKSTFLLFVSYFNIV
jgi:hypothetical protein